MRILGSTKTRSRVILCIEHLITVLFGAIIGLITISILVIESTFGFEVLAELPLLTALYITGAIIGSITGATIITNRSPLDLLQVRE
jgi:hypothetical protein